MPPPLPPARRVGPPLAPSRPSPPKFASAPGSGCGPVALPGDGGAKNSRATAGPESDLGIDDAKSNAQRPPDSLQRINQFLQSIGDLASACSAWQVGSGAAIAIARMLDARGVVIHHHDRQRRLIRIIGVEGRNAVELLGGACVTDDDYVATAVLSSGRPLALRLRDELPWFAPPRFGELGASRSIVALPIMSGAGCVAIIEIVDADERREASIADVCDLVTEQLLRVLSPAA